MSFFIYGIRFVHIGTRGKNKEHHCYAITMCQFFELIVIYLFQDGKAVSATLVCGLLIYVKFFEVPEDGLQLFAIKRCPPNMSASELRYLYYLSNIVREIPLYPHFKPVTLVSLQMQPVPLFTKIRFVEF